MSRRITRTVVPVVFVLSMLLAVGFMALPTTHAAAKPSLASAQHAAVGVTVTVTGTVGSATVRGTASAGIVPGAHTPYDVGNYCLSVYQSALTSTGTNTLKFNGSVTNTCGYQVNNVHMSLYTWISGCGGKVDSSQDDIFLGNIGSGGVKSYIVNSWGRCVHCWWDGFQWVHDWPSFYLNVETSAYGTSPSGTAVDSNVRSDSQWKPNDITGQWDLPCP